LVTPILNALKDRDSDVRSSALKALEKISTESLIDYYWALNGKDIIAFIVPRFYEVALTVENAENSNQHKLVLHSNKVQEWTKPTHEVEHFKKLIRKAAFPDNPSPESQAPPPQ
ncbi:MAG: HEAT repeat domain-containing protein, partial [Bacteroidota bacterium]